MKRSGSVGSFRTAHGTAAKGGQTVVFEAVPDGMRPAEPPSAEVQAPIVGKPFDSDTARSAAALRWALDKLPDFDQRELEFVAAEPFKPFDRARRGLLSARISELVTQYGHCSPGTVTVLRGWAWMVAFGEYYAAKAAQEDSAGYADVAAKHFKNASIELAKAHEFARVEGEAKPKKTPADVLWEKHLAEQAAAKKSNGGQQ